MSPLTCGLAAAWLQLAALANGPVERTVSLGNSANDIDTYTLSDGHSLVVVGPAPAMGRIAASLRKDGRITRRALPGGRAEVLLRSTLPLTEVETNRNQLTYRVTDLRTQVVEHLQERPRKPLPTAYTFDKYDRVERSIQKGDYRRAEKRLLKLAETDELKGYAMLRVADIAYIKGDVTSACAAYESERIRNEKSTAGVLAAIRAHTIRCPGAAYERGPWVALLENILLIGGEVGDALWLEAMWTLSVGETLDSIRLGILLTEKFRSDGDYMMPGVDTLRQALMSRLIWRTTDPVENVKSYISFASEVGAHAEYRHHSLEVARDFMQSGLPQRATELLEPLMELDGARRRKDDPAWESRNGNAQVHRLLVDAYAAAGWPALARDLAERYAALYGEPVPRSSRLPGEPYVTPITEDIQSLEGRVTMVERLMKENR